MFMFTVL